MEDRQVRQLVARAESLLKEVESLEDSKAKSIAVEAIQILFELYGEGFARMVDQAAQHDMADLLDTYKQDELISHLLLIHGLHPEDIETRVLRALDEVRPYMESHGGNVAFLGVNKGIAHLRLIGSCNGCASSSVTLKLAVDRAIQKHAPDLLGIKAEGAVEPPLNPTRGFVSMSALKTAERLNQDG